MAVLTRSNYIPNTLIQSAAVNIDFNQLVDLLSGVSTTKDALIKFSHATDPVLRVDQLGAGVIQRWLQNGVEKARILNDGALFVPALRDTNGNEFLILTATGSAVNELTLVNAATGGGPALSATGGDANINFTLAAKGTGRVIIKGYPFTLEVNTTAAGNVGAGLDNLQSYSLPAGSLAANGDYIEAWLGGDFAANDNDKRLVFSFGGTSFEDTGTRDLDAALGWTLQARIVRLSSTSVRVSHTLGANLVTTDGAGAVVNLNTGSFFSSASADITGLADLGANATTLIAQAEATANDDVTQTLTIVRLVQR